VAERDRKNSHTITPATTADNSAARKESTRETS
jgi:hypothetical protein